MSLCLRLCFWGTQTGTGVQTCLDFQNTPSLVSVPDLPWESAGIVWVLALKMTLARGVRYTKCPLSARRKQSQTGCQTPTPLCLPGPDCDSRGTFPSEGRETVLHFANGVRWKWQALGKQKYSPDIVAMVPAETKTETDKLSQQRKMTYLPVC